MVQGHFTSKVISVNFTSCGKNLHSLLNSPQLGPDLHNAIPTPTTGRFKLTYIPFPEYSQSKCSFHFLANVCKKCPPITLLLSFHKMVPVVFHNKMADFEEAF